MLGMDRYEVRTYPGWHHHRLTTMLAHVLLWHLKLRVGEKSTGPHRLAAADRLGSRLTPADIDDCRGVGVRRAGAKAQSPGVSSAATRGRMRLWIQAFFTTELFFVVKNSLQSAVLPSKVPSPEETEGMSLTTIGAYPQGAKTGK